MRSPTDYVSASVLDASVVDAPVDVTTFVYNHTAGTREDIREEIVASLEGILERVFDPDKSDLLQEIEERFGPLGVVQAKKSIFPRMLRQEFLAAVDKFTQEMREKDVEDVLEQEEA